VLALGVADEKQASGATRLFGIQENPEALDELQRKVRTLSHRTRHLESVAQGVLITLPSASCQQARYAKPMQSAKQVDSLSSTTDNELLE